MEADWFAPEGCVCYYSLALLLPWHCGQEPDFSMYSAFLCRYWEPAIWITEKLPTHARSGSEDRRWGLEMVLLPRQGVCSLTGFVLLCLCHGDLQAGEEACSCSSNSVSPHGGLCSACGVCVFNGSLISDLKSEIDKLATEYISNARTLSSEEKLGLLKQIQEAYGKCKEFGDDKVQLAMQTYEMVWREVFHAYVNAWTKATHLSFLGRAHSCFSALYCKPPAPLSPLCPLFAFLGSGLW